MNEGLGTPSGDPFRYMMAKWLYGYGLPLRIIERLQVATLKNLLIIGSGLGDTAILIATKKGCTVHGLEVHPQLVERARKRAAERGLGGRISFDVLREDRLKDLKMYDAVFIETLLGFLPEPLKVLALVSESVAKSVRIGVLEITCLDPLTPTEKEYFSKVFGGGFSPTAEDEWVGTFDDLGLKLVSMGSERIGLLKKFWDDLSASPIFTLRALMKTFYSVAVSRKSREAMGEFRTVMERYGDKIACTYYVLEKE